MYILSVALIMWSNVAQLLQAAKAIVLKCQKPSLGDRLRNIVLFIELD